MQKTVKKLFHACIVQSQDENARKELAQQLAMQLLCSGSENAPCGICRDCRKVQNGTHPDLIHISRAHDAEGNPRREIYVDQIRALVADALVLPNEAERKVYIISEAEFMNTSAQNAMLKLLEEPPTHAAFILCTTSAESLLETIRSRCEVFSVNAETISPENGLAQDFVRMAASSNTAELIRFCTANEGLDTRSAAQFVAAAKVIVSEMLCLRAPDLGLSRRGMAALLEVLGRAETFLSANVGVKHVFGFLSTVSLQELK